MRFSTQYVVLLAAAMIALPGSVQAQLHSPQVRLHRKDKEPDLSWMWQYAKPAPGGDENALALDPRFRPLLQRSFTAPQGFWGKGQTLAEAAIDFLSGPPGSVIGEDNRYISADACVQHFCPDRGLLWMDLSLPQPLLVFSAIDWISDNKSTDQKDATYTMWVFSNRPLDPAHVPPALRRSVQRWTSQPSSGSEDLQNITRVFLVDPDGTPHPVNPSTMGAHNTLPAETTAETKVQP